VALLEHPLHGRHRSVQRLPIRFRETQSGQAVEDPRFPFRVVAGWILFEPVSCDRAELPPLHGFSLLVLHGRLLGFEFLTGF
jgi:hypothetical protein